MSRGQTPRTPRYFPRMKVRGARRKRMTHIYAMQRFGDVVSIKIVPNVQGFVDALTRTVNATQMIRNEYGSADAEH